MTPITKEELLRLRDRLAEEYWIEDGTSVEDYKAGFDALLVPLLSCVEALEKANARIDDFCVAMDNGKIDMAKEILRHHNADNLTALTALAELVKEKK